MQRLDKSSRQPPRGVQILLALMVLATDDSAETRHPDQWHEDGGHRDGGGGTRARVKRTNQMKGPCGGALQEDYSNSGGGLFRTLISSIPFLTSSSSL